MSNENKNVSIAIIDPASFGIEPAKANKISKAFEVYDKQLEAIKPEYNEIYKMAQSPERSALARALRLKIVPIRTSCESTRKAEKDFYMKGSKFVDGLGNARKSAMSIMEEVLREIEEFEERKEAARLEQVAAARLQALIDLGKDSATLPGALGTMDESIWNSYYAGEKALYEQRKTAEREAEALRIDQEKKAETFNARRLELAKYSRFPVVEKLTMETNDAEYAEILAEAVQLNDKYEKEQADLRAEKERLEREAEERAEQERLAEEQRQKVAAEREAAENARRAEEERRLAAERAEKERLAEELRKKEQAEKERLEREAAEREAARQAELAKGDAEKMDDVRQEIGKILDGYEFKSKKYDDLFGRVSDLLDRALEEIERVVGDGN